MRYYIYLLLAVLFFYCSTPNQKKKFINNNNISVFDSIQINESNITYDKQNKNTIIFHNITSFSIFIYDKTSKKLKTFNNFGDNFDKHGYILNNINFYNDTIIAIGKTKGVNLYNFKGKFINYLPIHRDKQAYSPISNILFLNDSMLVYKESIGNGYSSNPNNYKLNEHIGRIYHLKKGLLRKFGRFPENKSVYNDPKYFYSYPFLFTFNKKKSYIYTLSWNDPNIYQYEIKTGQLTHSYNLDLIHYSPYKTNFNENNELNMDKIILANYQNSEIYNFDLNDSLFFIAYTKAFDKDGAIKALANDEEKRNCLHIRNRSGKILYDDILPEYLGKFMFEENDTLYFLGKTTEKSENENYSTLYMAKLSENK